MEAMVLSYQALSPKSSKRRVSQGGHSRNPAEFGATTYY